MQSEWVRYYCPFCAKRGKTPDTKGKLYVNWRENRYLCFRCEARGKASSLRGIALIPHNSQSHHSLTSIDGSLWDLRRYVDYSIEEVKQRFPQVFSFLKRKHALHLFPTVKLTFLESGIALAIPISMDYKHFQVRLFTNGGNNVKYLTPPAFMFRKVKHIPGFQELQSDTCVLVEGILDYYRLRGVAVAILGRYISKPIIDRLILCKNVKRFVVLWDSDSRENAVRDAIKLWRMFPHVEVYAGIILSEGSPSDCDLNSIVAVHIPTGQITPLVSLIGRYLPNARCTAGETRD